MTAAQTLKLSRSQKVLFRSAEAQKVINGAVRMAARHFPSLDRGDAYSLAQEGMCLAVLNFEPGDGFSTFSSRWVWFHMLPFMRRNRQSVHVHRLIAHVAVAVWTAAPQRSSEQKMQDASQPQSQRDARFERAAGLMIQEMMTAVPTPETLAMATQERRQLAAAIDSAIAALPQDLACVMRWSRKGLTSQGIAEETGWSESTVKRRIRGGREQLRQALESAGFGSPATSPEKKPKINSVAIPIA